MNDIGVRRKRSRRRPGSGSVESRVAHPPMSGALGGRYQPLNADDLPVIDRAVRSILSDVGMAEAPACVIDPVTRAGGSLDADGRLHFSAEKIDNALSG